MSSEVSACLILLKIPGKLNIFEFLKIMHQNIGTIFNSKFRSVKDHMIVIDIAPGLSGMFIIVGGSFFVSLFHFLSGTVVIQMIFLHDTQDAVFFVCTYKNIQDIHTVFKNIGSTASEDDTGLFCQFADCFCLRFIFMIVDLFLDIGFIVYRNTQSFGKL